MSALERRVGAQLRMVRTAVFAGSLIPIGALVGCGAGDGGVQTVAAIGASSPPASRPTVPLIASASGATRTDPPKKVADGTYSITIWGALIGGSFELAGTLRVENRAVGGAAVTEVCVRAGDPIGLPEVGAIVLQSSSVCVGRTAPRVELGRVEVQGANVTLTPIASRVATPTTPGQTFTALADAVGCPMTPVSGQLRATFAADGSVTGSIKLDGAGPTACGRAGYDAQFSGARSK
jgi:hypothetical protein